MKKLFILPTILLLLSCSSKLSTFKVEDQPSAPDYSQEQYWSALPFREDAPDAMPYGETAIPDSIKPVDVFYIYPTLFKNRKTWNADVDNKKLNKRIDKLPVRLQASVFNNVGRIYAPRYRQGNVACFDDTTGNGRKALDFAYQDVKAAFEYYMQHFNEGRPIIIASHSQGTTHARELLKDYFDTPEMKSKLVCAYIVGFGVYPDQYTVLQPCKQPEETGCYVTWSTFKEGYIYKGPLEYYGKICINPISWTMDTLPMTTNGGVLLQPGKKKSFTTTAHIHGNFLWAKTDMTLARRWKVMHLVDYNLFWHDIRKNAALRVNTYLKGLNGK